MDRNSVLRWLAIAGAIFLFWKFGLPLITGDKDKPKPIPGASETYVNGPGFVPDAIDPPLKEGETNKPSESEADLCKIQGQLFDAELSARGAALTHFYLRGAQYAGPGGFDLSTTPDQERWRSLRTLFRGAESNDQVKYDRFVWKLERGEGDKACKFTYEDEGLVKIEKTVSAGERPYELVVDTKITNLASAPKKHQLTISASSYHREADVKGSLGRQSPFQTELSCAVAKDVTRKSKDDLKGGTFTAAGTDRYAAVTSLYFAQALIPVGEGDKPACALSAEGGWMSAGFQGDDAEATLYQARLAYPPKELAPQATASYKQIAFFGPKEKDVLKNAGGGAHVGLKDVTNLGFFTPVARVLIGILDFIHDHITFGNWGLAIIVLTVSIRTILFPLTFKSIKTTIAMRRLKPEVDALNAKFADDAQAKNLAMMELWKKHGVNPFGGCLPQLVQMPVWFAMYTTLQTAVEMYHTKFLWFSDLSQPDKYFILPLLLGVFMIVQQRIVPQQGMDPMQQKMMMYMMPAVFTVMMLFLPAALGVYMLTNSLLGIGQQLAVERLAPSGGGGPSSKKGTGKEIVVKQVGETRKDSKNSKPPPSEKAARA